MISKPTLTISLPDGKTAGLYHAGEKASVDLLTAANEVKTYLKSRAMKRENKLTIKTVVSLVVLLLLMAVPSFGKDKNSPPTEDIDPLAKNYAQSLFEAIQKQHLHNQYLNRIGKASEVNFIIDMRNYIHNPQHPELNSQPFVSPSVKQALNGQINSYYHTYRHPFYIILSPIYARALDNSIGRRLFNPDILDFDEPQVWATFRERYQVYLHKLTQQKHALFPAALEGRISDGAILDIESQIFHKLIDDNYQISFDVSLILSQTVDKSELIEDYYNKKIKANPAAFSIAYRHEPALQSYVQTVTEAFKTYYSPYRQPQNLSEQMAANLRTLSLPMYVMVRNNGYRLLREDTDHLYLDQWDQTFYDLHLGTGGGKPYFYIDGDGYVDATAMKYEDQQANPVIALSQLARTVRDVLVSTKIILDIVRVVGGDYLENNRPITELLEADAKQGTLSGTGLIQKASAARSKLYNEIQNGHYSGDELRARLLMLFDLTETLKKVFAQDSKYPFQRLTLAQIKVQAVTDSKVAPTDKDKALLDYLEQRIARGETLPAELQAEYLRLLCKLKGDCREGSQFLGTGGDLSLMKSILNDDIRRFVGVIVSDWNDESKNKFYLALADPVFANKINNAQGNVLYSKHEKISFEVMDWLKVNSPNPSVWLSIARSEQQKNYFRAYRYVFAMQQDVNYINISLGIGNANLSSSARSLKSTHFGEFYTRGFIAVNDIIGAEDYKVWMPLVAETIKRSYDHGGKIYFHMDNIDIKAMYDLNHPNFGGGTIAELRYLIDNGLVDMGRVEFRLGNSLLPRNDLDELLKAIEKHKKNVITLPDNNYGSWKNKFGIEYK